MNQQDKRYLRLQPIFNHPAQTKIIITSRGTGKSYSYKYHILEEIEKHGKEFIWLRRQFDSIRTGSLESWKRVIANYCQDNQVSPDDIELVWDAITRGIKYKGTMKCFMVELFSSYKARENYTQTISEIVFDEAIINPSTGEKYLEAEEEKIRELLGSAWRDKNEAPPAITYLANPYERFRGFMEGFLPLIRKQRETLRKRVFKHEPVILEGNKEVLFLFKDELSEDDLVWQGFFAREEDLKMCEFVNGSRALFVFNGCVLFQAKKGYWFFVGLESKGISKREELPFIKEYCINYEQRLKSRQKVKWDYEESLLREELLGKWERGRLYFVDANSREIIMEFMGKGKVKFGEIGKFI